MTTHKNVGWVRPQAVTHQDDETDQRAWPVLTIEEVADVNPRVDKSAIPDNLPVSFVPMPAVGAGDGSIHIEATRPAGEVKKGFTAFLEGDVLFAKITPCMENGKMAVVPKLVNGYGFGSTEFHVLRTKLGIDSKYLYYYVSSQSFRGEAERYMTGAVGQKRVSTDYLKRSTIPVAPLDQQKRIVAEIEKQFSRLDEAVANLKRVKANLKRYKAAVLKAAVEGRLVETEAELARRLLAHGLSACDAQAGAQASEGRSLPTPRPGVFYVYAIKCNDDSIYVGHTDNLARRWEEHLAGQAADWTKQHKPIQIVHYEEYSSRQEAANREKWLKTGYGRKWIKREIEAGRARPACAPRAGKQVGYETGAQLLQRMLETRRSEWKGKGKYKEPVAPDTTDLPELPEGWVWTSLDSLIVDGPQNGLYLPKSLYGSGHPILRIDDYQQDWIRPVMELQRVRAKPVDVATYSLRSGDIVINRVNSPSHLGKVAVWATEKEMPLFESNMMRAALSSSAVPLYVATYLRSLHGRARLTKQAKWAVNQASINQQDVCGTQVPLPPFAEQHRIVAEVDRRLSLVREVEAQVDANLLRGIRLRHAILGNAFSGKISALAA